MKSRDKLALLMAEVIPNDGPVRLGLIADAVLTAGYRKPRTITTVEELDALIGESVVRSDAGIVYEKYPDEDGPEYDYWLMPGEPRAQAATKIDLPATILYEPEAA